MYCYIILILIPERISGSILLFILVLVPSLLFMIMTGKWKDYCHLSLSLLSLPLFPFLFPILSLTFLPSLPSSLPLSLPLPSFFTPSLLPLPLPDLGIGPLYCPPLIKTSAVTMSISAPILLLMCLCGCFSVFKLYETGWPNTVLYSLFCCNCFTLILLFALTAFGSMLVFEHSTLSILKSGAYNNTHCQLFVYAPLGSVGVVYLLCVLYFCLLLWFLMCEK